MCPALFSCDKRSRDKTGFSNFGHKRIALYLSGKEPKVLIMTHFFGEPADVKGHSGA